MGSESAISTHASIISIDPAIVSHITGTTQATSMGAHSHNYPSSAKQAKASETMTTRAHTRNKSVPISTDKKIPNSLSRAKNSTEVLRQRSTKSSNKAKQLETIPDTREGRNFTISNVGTGGVLYLKPSAHQNASIQTSPRGLMPLNAPIDLPALAQSDENIKPLTKHQTRSDSPSTATRATSSKQSFTKATRRPTIGTVPSRQGRSQSFSTAEQQRPSFTGARSNTLKIVINRSETAKSEQSQDTQHDAPNLSLPTLEVPIPHYRMGTPRFSDHGTPMLRSSAYSRASATPSNTSQVDATVQAKQLGSGPPPSSARAFARLGSSPHAGSEGREDRFAKPRPATSDSANTDSTIREPIHPEIYDALAEVYDDPSVVRYSQNVREISAAIPARIIAQISSESFMDYELVSDFFLTFRSYMSTYTVLDLLLARLRWAIDKPEDDGRIIRVRTFAALRHWILNYFMDDFISDKKLRVRFCNEINHMYQDVSSRAGHGTSDLKVLRDLKRCWNGRCSMYWDPADFSLDGDQDDNLQPGGLDEFQPIQMSVGVEDPPPVPNPRAKAYSTSSWFDTPPTIAVEAQEERQMPNAKQASVGSEHSLQAKSCSIPRNLLRSSGKLGSPEPGSNPVPVQLRRKDAPANLEVQTTGHRRGAASIDSDREPTPRNTSMSLLQPLQGASLVRGSIYGPSAPFVQIVSSPTTSAISRFETNDVQVNGVRRAGSPHSTQAPGVKNIFGSLRKALAGRHGQSDMALVTVSSPIPILPNEQMQRSPMPLNMSRSHDELRSPQQAGPQKGQVRIDLLCAQVSQTFETLFPYAKHEDATLAMPARLGVRPPSPEVQVDPALLTPDLRDDRLPSHTTAQSGSILIVNDTGVVMPEPSGALHSHSQTSLHPESHANQMPKLHFGLGIDHPRSSFAGATTQRSSDALGEATDSPEALHPDAVTPTQYHFATTLSNGAAPVTSPKIVASTIGSSTTMRRKSYQSSMEAGEGQPSIVATATTVSAHEDEGDGSDDESLTRIPAQSLRRRPGGDLRKVENVHDLDHAVHHDSLATTTTTTTTSGTPIHSFSANATPTRAVTLPLERKPVSMINTHSSQHLRPSFEAAVSGFSHIPDDGDGGLEATLLKLEGRYEQMSPPLEQHPMDATQRRRSMPEIGLRRAFDADSLNAEPPQAQQAYARDPSSHQDTSMAGPSISDNEDASSSRKSSIFGLPVGSVDGSEASDEPQPLLQRETVSGPITQPKERKIMPSPLHLQRDFDDTEILGDGLLHEQELRPSLQARPSTAAESFLLDEDENLSDLSSEISVDIINYSHPADQSYSPMLAAPGTALSGLEIPSHPLTYASVVNLAPATERGRDSMIRDSQLVQNGADMGGQILPTSNISRTAGGPAHIPFILACDSQVLAQQMTLIEKSALTEVEWSDLVDRRWDSNPIKVLDWAELLAKADVYGVDLVVTRFNLVSKWVRSEVVLTQNIEERAQVIAKYIHIAAHARRLHNYATMVQIAIGLTSTDCMRLTKTWEKVPGPDRSLLKNMEVLVQPIRNFHELRLEIESADLRDGCIPFLGLYVRDLTYNAQKPAQIASRSGSEPLINFERFRQAAVIVKGLLQLIDASARYTFEPQRGIIERCLWMATLSEEKIYTLSRSLEQ